MNNSLVIALLAASVLAVACKKKKDPLPVPYETLTTTSNYYNTFKGTDSVTSVSITEAPLRVKMLGEIEENLLAFGTTFIDATKIKQMLENTNSRFADTSLKNATGISIMATFAQSFTVAGRVTEVASLYAWCDSASVASESARTVATPGKAGTIGGAYLISAKGIEYTQLIKNAVTGGMILDQLCNIFLGAEKMSADNTAPVAGKNYTALAHNWDQAYGYLTPNDYFPKANSMGAWQEVFLGNYVRQVKGFFGDPTALYLTFLKGRAAIVNKDNNMRNQQATAACATLEKAVATVVVSYLNKTLNALSEGNRFHALSEGVSLIYALRYAHNPKIPASKSDEMIKRLTDKPNGFWSVSNTDIESLRNEIALLFTVDRDALVNP